MNFLHPLGTFLWDNFDLILFGFLALLALEELSSGFSMIELARGQHKRAPKAPQEAPLPIAPNAIQQNGEAGVALREELRRAS